MCLPSVSHRCDPSLSLCALHLPICTERILNVWWRDKKRQKKRQTEMQTTAILVKKLRSIWVIKKTRYNFIFIPWLLLPHTYGRQYYVDLTSKSALIRKKTMKWKLAMLSFYWEKWVSESAQGVIHYFSKTKTKFFLKKFYLFRNIL